MSTQNQSLLAILIALENSFEPLTDEQKNSLYKMGQQLGARPKKWSSYIDEFLAIFPENSEFVILYEQALEDLKKLSSQQIFDFLSDQEDMQKIFSNIPVIKRAYFEGQADQQSQEICNFVSAVLKTSQPLETTKKLKIYQRIAQFFKSSD